MLHHHDSDLVPCRSSGKVGQAVNIGKAPSKPDKLTCSGAAYARIPRHCSRMVCQTGTSTGANLFPLVKQSIFHSEIEHVVSDTANRQARLHLFDPLARCCCFLLGHARQDETLYTAPSISQRRHLLSPILHFQLGTKPRRNIIPAWMQPCRQHCCYRLRVLHSSYSRYGGCRTRGPKPGKCDSMGLSTCACPVPLPVCGSALAGCPSAALASSLSWAPQPTLR